MASTKTISDIIKEQEDFKGPIPRDEQLPGPARHRCANMSAEMGEGMLSLVSMIVPDYACPSFCTASQVVFGEAPALREYCAAEDIARKEMMERHNEKEALKHYRSMEDTLDRALRGEQATWADMGCSKLIPDLHPQVYAYARIDESDFKFLHYNVWDWTYAFTADEVHTEVAWLSFVYDSHICKDMPFDEDPESATYKNAMANARTSTDPLPPPMFVRAIRVQIENPNRFYGHSNGMFEADEQQFGSARRFATRLFLIERRFENEDELMEDIANFPKSGIDYTSIFDAMLGDG